MSGKKGVWSNPEFCERIRIMWADGKSYTEIGNTVGMTRSSVCAGIDRMKLPKRAENPRNHVMKKPEVRQPFNPAPTEQHVLSVSGMLEIAEPALLDGEPVTIRNCNDRTCRWPLDEAGPDMRMCGHPPVFGAPYCEAHRRKALQPQHGHRREAVGMAE